MAAEIKSRRAIVAVAMLLVAGALGSTLVGLRSAFVERKPSRLILDRRGRYLGEVAGQGEALGYWPMPADLPDRLVKATLETEDRYFHSHRGVRWASVARAIAQDARSLRIVSGASTIAMQVARLQSPGRRTPLRKLKEMIEAYLLIRAHGHEQVLRRYLLLAP